MLRAHFLRFAVTILIVIGACSYCVAQSATDQSSDDAALDDTGMQASAPSGKAGADASSTTKKSKATAPAKADAKPKGDTSKTAFDEGTYAEATAIAYKAMQDVAGEIAHRKPKEKEATTSFIVFDPDAFANVTQFRVTLPQLVMMRSGICQSIGKIERKTQTKTESIESLTPTDTASMASSAVPGLGIAGEAVDLVQKVLTMMQTTTTIEGASVEVTDAALVAEVAQALGTSESGNHIPVYYPGQFLLPNVKNQEITAALKEEVCLDSELDKVHPLILELMRLGAAREKAAARYAVIKQSIDLYNAKVAPVKQPTAAAPAGKGQDGKVQPQTKDPTPQEKAAAAQQLKDRLKESLDQALTDEMQLKAYLDEYDAILKSLATVDSKGRTTLSRLVVAERLDGLIQPMTCTETALKAPASCDSALTGKPVVVVVKWVRAGALNKTRKNLFFLGQRNYYAGGATALYEYFDDDQDMLSSGTVTETSPYVHDKDFDKGKTIKMVKLTPTTQYSKPQ